MKITKPKQIKNWQYYFIGVGMLLLNYFRHKFLGYTTPRTFSIKQISRAVEYDFKVSEEWIKYLSEYLKQTNFLREKVILELGPGPDLGIGLVLLAAGVKKYIALDVHKLSTSTPLAFYNKLLIQIKNKYPNCNIDYLKEQLDKCHKNENAALSYVVDENFEISKIREKFDIIFSQAAFEHFTNVKKTFKELNSVVSEGSILVTVIDLKTHTRWIRDEDPLNIYRYSDFFWNLFKFKGSPNRIRVFEYKELLERNGWYDIQIIPTNVLEDEYMSKVMPTLHKRFRDMEPSEMKILSIMLMAKKGKSKLAT